MSKILKNMNKMNTSDYDIIYVPKSISLISNLPIFEAQNDALKYIYNNIIRPKRSKKIEKSIKIPKHLLSQFHNLYNNCVNNDLYDIIDDQWEKSYLYNYEKDNDGDNDYISQNNNENLYNSITEDHTLMENHLLEFYISAFFSLLPIKTISKEIVLLKPYHTTSDNNNKELIRYRINNNIGINLPGFNFIAIFKKLSIINIMKIIKSILLERKIIIFSKNPGDIPNITETLMSLISPLTWMCIYIPYLPISMVDVVDSFMPYIIGMAKKYMKYVLSNHDLKDTVIIDLDEDKIILEEKIYLPKKAKDYILDRMGILLKQMKNTPQYKLKEAYIDFTLKVKQAFNIFFLQIINNYLTYFDFSKKDEGLALPGLDTYKLTEYFNIIPKEDIPFMEIFCKQTMMFSRFLEDSYELLYNCDIKNIEKWDDQLDEISQFIKIIKKVSYNQQYNNINHYQFDFYHHNYQNYNQNNNNNNNNASIIYQNPQHIGPNTPNHDQYQQQQQKNQYCDYLNIVNQLGNIKTIELYQNDQIKDTIYKYKNADFIHLIQYLIKYYYQFYYLNQTNNYHSNNSNHSNTTHHNSLYQHHNHNQSYYLQQQQQQHHIISQSYDTQRYLNNNIKAKFPTTITTTTNNNIIMNNNENNNDEMNAIKDNDVYHINQNHVLLTKLNHNKIVDLNCMFKVDYNKINTYDSKCASDQIDIDDISFTEYSTPKIQQISNSLSVKISQNKAIFHSEQYELKINLSKTKDESGPNTPTPDSNKITIFSNPKPLQQIKYAINTPMNNEVHNLTKSYELPSNGIKTITSKAKKRCRIYESSNSKASIPYEEPIINSPSSLRKKNYFLYYQFIKRNTIGEISPSNSKRKRIFDNSCRSSCERTDVNMIRASVIWDKMASNTNEDEYTKNCRKSLRHEVDDCIKSKENLGMSYKNLLISKNKAVEMEHRAEDYTSDSGIPINQENLDHKKPRPNKHIWIPESDIHIQHSPKEMIHCFSHTLLKNQTPDDIITSYPFNHKIKKDFKKVHSRQLSIDNDKKSEIQIQSPNENKIIFDAEDLMNHKLNTKMHHSPRKIPHVFINRIEDDLKNSNNEKMDSNARKIIFEKLKSPIKKIRSIETPNRNHHDGLSEESKSIFLDTKLIFSKDTTTIEKNIIDSNKFALASSQLQGDLDESPERLSSFEERIFRKENISGNILPFEDHLNHQKLAPRKPIDLKGVLPAISAIKIMNEDIKEFESKSKAMMFVKNLDTGELISIHDLNKPEILNRKSKLPIGHVHSPNNISKINPTPTPRARDGGITNRINQVILYKTLFLQ